MPPIYVLSKTSNDVMTTLMCMKKTYHFKVLLNAKSIKPCKQGTWYIVHQTRNVCVKNSTYNGCDNGVWSPTNYTTYVVEHVELPRGKTNTPLRKEFLLVLIKKIVTLILPSTFANMLSLRAYHWIQKHCACPNYDAIPNISKIWKQTPSLILGQPCENCANTHCLGVK